MCNTVKSRDHPLEAKKIITLLVVPLPPEVLLNTGSTGGETVVEVHDDMYPHVQEPAERGVAAPHISAKYI